MRGLLACLTITTLLGACTPGQAPAEPAQPPLVMSPTIINQPAAVVDVPSDFDGVWLEFAGVRRGYAMFTKYSETQIEARLFSTDDGGLTWTARTHPQPIAKDQQLDIVDGDSVALRTSLDTRYVSHDNMVSWQRGGQYGYARGKGPFFVHCPQDNGACEIRSNDAGPDWRRALPDGFFSLTNLGGGRYWLAGIRDGAPVTQLDGRELAVPAQSGRKVHRAEVMVSQDGADTWLIAEQEPLEMATGRTGVALKNSVQAKPCSCAATVGAERPTLAAARMKATGLPLIWRLRDGAWVAHPTTTIKEKPNWPYPVAPAGGGLLVISGPDGAMYFGDRPTMIAGLPGFDWVGQTWDGTPFARPQGDQHTIYLSTGLGAARQWIKVGLSRR